MAGNHPVPAHRKVTAFSGGTGMFREQKLSLTKMKEILAEVKKGEIHRVMFKNEQLYQYFPRNYTPEQMKNKILEVLEAWQADTSENK